MEKSSRQIVALLAFNHALLLVITLTSCGGPRMTINTAIELLDALAKVRSNPITQEIALTPDALTSLSSQVEILGKPCHFSPAKEDSHPNHASEQEAKIEGEQCPIEYAITLNSSMAKTITETRYLAKADELKKINPIDRLNVKIESITHPSLNISEIKLDISANSTQKGKIILSMNGKVQEKDIHNGIAEKSGTLSVSNQTAEIRHTVKMIQGAQIHEVYINGEKLNPDERDRVIPALIH